MNCPHCGGDEKACHRDDPCLGRMTELVTEAIGLAKEIAQCTHSGTDGEPLRHWCPLCGAIVYGDRGVRLPFVAKLAKKLDEKWPTVDPPRRGEYNDLADEKRRRMKSDS
jgi:hypothetical protein